MTSPPLELRIAVGAVGALLLLVGARVYRFMVVAPGILGGAIGVWLANERFDLDLQGNALLATAAVAAAIGAFVCHYAERVAIVLLGVGVGVAATVAALPFAPADWWWLPLAGALAGGLLAAPVFRFFLPLLTAGSGGAAVVWALGWPASPWGIGALTVLGVAVQLLLGRGAAPGRKGAAKPNKKEKKAKKTG
jgi:hypothetical protein